MKSKRNVTKERSGSWERSRSRLLSILDFTYRL